MAVNVGYYLGFGFIKDFYCIAGYDNSFVFELKNSVKENNYENCHILSQPYSGGQFAVINNSNKYIYSIPPLSQENNIQLPDLLCNFLLIFVY